MRLRYLVLVVALAWTGAAAQPFQLDDDQRRELAAFGIRAGLGLKIGPAGIKNPPRDPDLEELVATGLNGNGLLCADVVDIRALRLLGRYEVTCVAYRGGAGRKTYVVDAPAGTAFEQ